MNAALQLMFDAEPFISLFLVDVGRIPAPKKKKFQFGAIVSRPNLLQVLCFEVRAVFAIDVCSIMFRVSCNSSRSLRENHEMSARDLAALSTHPHFGTRL
jgi:hypothetical protein